MSIKPLEQGKEEPGNYDVAFFFIRIPGEGGTLVIRG